ncbi:MAG: GTPase ObgE [Deltaproteobacteria bacterium]|nr:GTPase ObgE [Deltaproteobacteria bacterium]MBW2342080.1 GTPase ObgE [Deltaproteobacteria bacterium]
MGFIDEAEITVKSGDGGAGCISFSRERFLPKGGPDGGEGGKGGNVVIKTTRRLYSLYDLHSKILFKAQNGRPGRGNNRSGKRGKDIEVLVPIGTMVRDQKTGELLADLVYDNQHMVLVEGGAGGKGNAHFVTAANRAPRFAQEGQKGTEKRLKLELKLVADIGIVGLPNTGKSTLLSRISHAHPKIGNYPFTTVAPNLGVLSFDDEQSLTIADIPGLLEGASSGRGLGHRFLQHIERTRFLLHVLDVNQPHSGDIVKDFSILRQELERFHPCLTEKDQVVIINKIDLKPFGKKSIQKICQSFHDLGYECLAISAFTGKGVKELRQLLREKVSS